MGYKKKALLRNLPQSPNMLITQRRRRGARGPRAQKKKEHLLQHSAKKPAGRNNIYGSRDHTCESVAYIINLCKFYTCQDIDHANED